MKKYKINIDRPSVSPGEVREHMDFNKVLHQYNAVTKPFYKTGGFIATTAVVAVTGIAALVYTMMPADTPIAEIETPVVSAPVTTEIQEELVTPPIKNVDVKYNNYEVASDKETNIKHNNTTISIPSRAFIDKNGNLVTKPVNLTYREFKDAGDVITSGIPVVFDEESQTFNYRSSEMIEIEATVDGEKVTIMPGKTIDITIEDVVDGGELELYKLDKKSRRWKLNGTVKSVSESRTYTIPTTNNEETPEANIVPGQSAEMMQSIKDIDTKIKLVSKQLNELKLEKPDAPEEADADAYTFKIDIIKGEFPELEELGIEDLLFQIPSNDSTFNNEKYNIRWDSISLSANLDGKSYLLTLGLKDDIQHYTVYPVYTGKSYKRAYKEYKSKLDLYKTELRLKENELLSLQMEKAEYERQLREYRQQVQTNQQEPAESNETRIEETRVYRTFSISSFGIYNSVAKEEYPTELVFKPTFIDSENNAVRFKEDKYYLADLTINAMYAYSINADLGLNPKHKNLVWGILTNGKLAVVRNNQLAENAANTKIKLSVELADRDFKDIDEVKAFLGIN